VNIHTLESSWQINSGRGGELGRTGVVLLEKVRCRGGDAFIPPIFGKCFANLQCKKGQE